MKNKIAEFKLAEGLTVTALAKKLRLSIGYTSDLVNGKERVSQRTAARLAKLTGRPWHEFMPPPGRW